ncbi:hypothetical protein [Streptomyces tropicalis]|uniref:Uncharacterized protein n=1 Tax=Streptomyces tropicalis TaxID=3034234 RepID=A0ABT6A6N3_9ACTN|nr:hypothetical protein [Streptomyces tropicalis]MDF3300296.1 hypothetical protein [Streptomyces tropicalis]
MTTYVITIPGTFLSEPDDAARADLARRLRPADPHRTALGREEDLDLLTVNDDNTFSIRLEVTADDRRAAERKAKQTAASALREAGFGDTEAPLGPTTVTGIDNMA